MDLALFPLDTQTCHLTIASYGWAANDLVYLWKVSRVWVELIVDCSHLKLLQHPNPVQLAPNLFLPGGFELAHYSDSKVRFTKTTTNIDTTLQPTPTHLNNSKLFTANTHKWISHRVIYLGVIFSNGFYPSLRAISIPFFPWLMLHNNQFLHPSICLENTMKVTPVLHPQLT